MLRHLRMVCGSVLVGLGVGGVLGQPMPAAAAPAVTQPAAATGEMPAAMTEALKLPPGAERRTAVTAAVAEWTEKDPTAALAWAVAAKRKDGDAGGAIFGAVAKSNGKIAADWVVQQNTPAALRNFHGVMYVWGRTDPKAAAAWCMDAPANVRYLAFFSVGDGWYLRDVKGACAWVDSLKNDADRFAAIHGVALKWGRSSIPKVTVWIKTLKGQDRVMAAKAVVEDARANRLDGGKVKDPAAVGKWVDELGLSDAEKEDVLKGPPLPPMSAKPAVKGK